MRILVACDKFKGALDATGVCQAIAKGILESHPSAEISLHPMADGGDGTLTILDNYLSLNKITCGTIDPLSRPIESHYLSDEKTAYIELANASGIARLSDEEKDVLNCNTVGTGLLIKHAIANNHSKIVLGLGGSCSNDAGLGIALALGFIFLDKNNKPLIPCGGNLNSIYSITIPKINPINQLTILCDVENPMYGPSGAAFTFAKQKGADPKAVNLLDDGLKHIAKLIYKTTNKNITGLKGGGAAGGIAAGLFGLLDNVNVINGFYYLSELSGLEKKIQYNELIITGEGKLDQQSLNGKVVGKLLKHCKKVMKPIIAIVGVNTLPKAQSTDFKEIHSLVSIAESPLDSINNTEIYLQSISNKISVC